MIYAAFVAGTTVASIATEWRMAGQRKTAVVSVAATIPHVLAVMESSI